MLLYTDILPVSTESSQVSFRDYFAKICEKSDSIDIAVGYASKTSLLELDRLVHENGIQHICVTLGMYCVEGIPESLYNIAIEINSKWQKQGIGEIRMVTNMKYHGKLYVFYKNSTPVAGIIGSANLGAIAVDANNRRQYEIASATENSDEIKDIYNHISQVVSKCTSNIADIANINKVHEENTSLVGVDTVNRVPKSDVNIYHQHKTDISFSIPIKVPAYAERHMDDGKHYTKSNLNVCYAAPRSARKFRDWYETQFTVSVAITRLDGYPEKNVPFYAVTDDGYMFKVHTTSDHNKQFSAVGDELILGRWIKGRIASAGLVVPVNNTGEDSDRAGMITKEMLDAYGCNGLVITKTDKQVEEEGITYDVWTLSFEHVEGSETEED